MTTTNVSRMLAEETLEKKFDLIAITINRYGEEKVKQERKKKKEFLKQFANNEDFYVKLVDRYPDTMESNVFYVAKSGRTVWIRLELE